MYWILFIGIAVVSYLVQANLKRKFEKYSEVTVASGMTGAEVAQKMLRDNGIFDGTIELRVHDREEVKTIMNQLRNIDDLQEVQRIL